MDGSVPSLADSLKTRSSSSKADGKTQVMAGSPQNDMEVSRHVPSCLARPGNDGDDSGKPRRAF